MKVIVARYLKDVKKVNAKPTRGAGPDFIFGGQIIETKGSESGFDRTVKQMLEYAPKYSGLTLAVPVGFFTAEKVMQLNALAKVIYKQHTKMLSTLSILEVSSKAVFAESSQYQVGELQTHNLAYHVSEKIGEMNEWTYPETPAKPKNYEANSIKNIDTLVRAAIAQLTKGAFGSYTITVPIQESLPRG